MAVRIVESAWVQVGVEVGADLNIERDRRVGVDVASPVRFERCDRVAPSLTATTSLAVGSGQTYPDWPSRLHHWGLCAGSPRDPASVEHKNCRRGGCGGRGSFDTEVMDADAENSKRVLEEWRIGRAQRGDLYTAVRGGMYQGARRGLRTVLRGDPDEQDVEDVIYDAFCEFEAKDPHDIHSLLGLASHIARLRGIDRGRAIVRERQKMESALTDRAYQAELDFTDNDLQRARNYELNDLYAADCVQLLSDAQRSVVTATIVERTRLSDWALLHGKSHQAAGRQRDRALDTLRRCVQAKSGSPQEQEGGLND